MSAEHLTTVEIVAHETTHEVLVASRDVVMHPPVVSKTGEQIWYRLALDTGTHESVDVMGLDAIREIRDACQHVLDEARSEKPPVEEDRPVTLVDVGGMKFPFCSSCEQPMTAARAAVDSFRVIDQDLDRLKERSHGLLEFARSLIRDVERAQEGGFSGMRDPFTHWIDQGGGF